MTTPPQPELPLEYAPPQSLAERANVSRKRRGREWLILIAALLILTNLLISGVSLERWTTDDYSRLSARRTYVVRIGSWTIVDWQRSCEFAYADIVQPRVTPIAFPLIQSERDYSLTEIGGKWRHEVRTYGRLLIVHRGLSAQSPPPLPLPLHIYSEILEAIRQRSKHVAPEQREAAAVILLTKYARFHTSMDRKAAIALQTDLDETIAAFPPP